MHFAGLAPALSAALVGHDGNRLVDLLDHAPALAENVEPVLADCGLELRRSYAFVRKVAVDDLAVPNEQRRLSEIINPNRSLARIRFTAKVRAATSPPASDVSEPTMAFCTELETSSTRTKSTIESTRIPCMKRRAR